MSARHRSRLIDLGSTALRPVPADLLLVEGSGLMPRHQRLLVSSFALDTGCGSKAAMQQACSLYERLDPFQLDAPTCSVAGDYRPKPLTVMGVLVELEGLVSVG